MAKRVGPALSRLQIEPRPLLAGKWVNTNEPEIPVMSPATEETVATLESASREHVEEAVGASKSAQPKWWGGGSGHRSTALKRLASMLERHEDDLAGIVSAESGKPMNESIGEVEYARSFIELNGLAATHGGHGRSLPPTGPWRKLSVSNRPLGVTGLITPWYVKKKKNKFLLVIIFFNGLHGVILDANDGSRNFPLAMPARKLAPALAAGNGAVLKPAEETPLSALVLGALAVRAGVPEDLIRFVF